MERFGLSVQKPEARGKGGVPPEVLRGLFDRYNAGGGDEISYLEFSAAFFGEEEPEEEQTTNEQGGQNPWLPSLANKISMDPHYQRQTAIPHGRVRSIANPRKNAFSLD